MDQVRYKQSIADASCVSCMRRAIELARSHVGRTADNPSVGCLIVRDGVVLASGCTALGGRPHGEELALEAAREIDLRGATAFITLEPCGARTSGASSCAERLVRAGLSRIVVACTDPSPHASGRGLRRLMDAGAQVEVGLLADEARALYLDYFARYAQQSV